MNSKFITLMFVAAISVASFLTTPANAQGVPIQISLNSVVAISADDVWAVGNGVDSQDADDTDPAFEHWDGRQWRLVPGESTPDDDERIAAVDAVSSNDVWAVGDVGLRLQDDRQIEIQHWD